MIGRNLSKVGSKITHTDSNITNVTKMTPETYKMKSSLFDLVEISKEQSFVI